MGGAYPNILNRQSVLECLTDYILQVNYRGYRPDPRKMLAVRQSDRTATLRNASAPIRQEVYYFIEGEIFPKEGTTRMKGGQSPSELAEELLVQHYERLYIWVAYDFTKGSPPGFRKPFDNPLIIKGSSCPNPGQVNRRQAPEGVNPRFFLPDPLTANIGDGGISPDVALDEIANFVTDLVKRDFRNALPEGDNPPIWDEPLIGVASATDPLFERFQDPEVVGPCHRFPEEWLPGARSVISVFLPFTGHISENYSRSQRYSAVEFSSGKWNGSKFLNVVRRALVRFAESHGASAVAPNIDPRYDSDGWLPFWSERHAALAAGLGTFGLHQNFISEKALLAASAAWSPPLISNPRNATTRKCMATVSMLLTAAAGLHQPLRPGPSPMPEKYREDARPMVTRSISRTGTMAPAATAPPGFLAPVAFRPRSGKLCNCIIRYQKGNAHELLGQQGPAQA